MLFAWVFRSSSGVYTFKRLPIPENEVSFTQLVECTRRGLGANARCGARFSANRSGQLEALDPLAVDEERLSSDLQKMMGPEAALADPNSSTVPDKMLRRCHELLIEPIEEALTHEPRLLIVPDTDLYGLPFAALLSKDGTHLIEQHALRIAPSLGTLVELEHELHRRGSVPDRESRQASALVVGDPSYHGLYGQLTGAREEAHEVKNMLPECYSTKMLCGGDATKHKVSEAMHEKELIHLATHGAPDGICFVGRNRKRDQT